MRTYQIGTFLLSGLALIFAFQNCAKQGSLNSSSVNTVDSVEMQKTMATLKSQINAASVRDLSCQTNADCVAVAVGAAHCGSPTFYVVNSVRNASYGDVLQLAAEFKDVEHNYMSANQLVSTCEARAQPSAACLQNVCVTSPGR